ncbi:DUF4870 domain-containing protein [Phytohabitans rumicis]|uniref:DUF4870 domain-containing protein n=1 Tax=Phytohabitans rumicis TaxID=1076125 RepID=UPI00280BED8F|nr:DUF4870 domain-containing protein [Phytohabitans rumicis]
MHDRTTSPSRRERPRGDAPGSDLSATTSSVLLDAGRGTLSRLRSATGGYTAAPATRHGLPTAGWRRLPTTARRGYPPPGYPPQGPPGGYYGGPAPAGYANNEEKTWALVAHFGGAAGAFVGGGTLGWVGPLVALLAKGNQSPTVRAHAIAALNFQLLWSIITVVCWILVCALIGFILAPAAMIIAIVFGIIGGVKANDGQLYNYPMSVSIIK